MATIESYVEPLRLFRYRSLAHIDCEMDAIEKGYLYCAPYLKLNDPMEGLFTSSHVLRGSKNHHEISAAIRDNKARLGMCSFSEVRDHELMWAHYADQFRGVCIAYSLSRLLASLADSVAFVRMFYHDKVPVVRHMSEEPSRLARMVLSYKNYRWLYEREWRMFAPIGEAHYETVACVTHVYLGSRIERDKREQVMNTMKRLKIKTDEMTISNAYSISFRRCR